MKQKFLIAVFVIFSAVAIIACEKSNFETVTNFKVRLSASTAFDADEVNIDIEQVQVNYNDTTWVILNTPGQVYNLLDFRNGVDTLIAKGTLPATSVVKQLKLIFGANNSIKVGGKTLPLSITNNQTELTLNVDKKLNRNVEIVTLNFDPSLSVSLSADGGYQFKPVAALK